MNQATSEFSAHLGTTIPQLWHNTTRLDTKRHDQIVKVLAVKICQTQLRGYIESLTCSSMPVCFPSTEIPSIDHEVLDLWNLVVATLDASSPQTKYGNRTTWEHPEKEHGSMMIYAGPILLLVGSHLNFEFKSIVVVVFTAHQKTQQTIPFKVLRMAMAQDIGPSNMDLWITHQFCSPRVVLFSVTDSWLVNLPPPNVQY